MSVHPVVGGDDGRVDRGGAEYSRLYYEHLVGPIVEARWPGLARAAGRLGSGSDVLGLDDTVSRDHDWGLRLNLMVSTDVVAEVDEHLEATLPETFEGLPTRFTTTWDRAGVIGCRCRTRLLSCSRGPASPCGSPAAW